MLDPKPPTRLGQHYSIFDACHYTVHLAEAQSNMSEYAEAGFPGCVGSFDCTHIITERCEYNLKNNHLGGKSSQTARTFKLTCNHRRRILHTTHGGPARWNDMTMVWFDSFLTAVRAGSILTDNEFELLSYDKEGNVVSVRYNGVYVIRAPHGARAYP